jgi:hypothetical protein
MTVEKKNGVLKSSLVLKILDNAFTDRVSLVTGAKITIYISEPQLKVAATSFKNLDHLTISPQFDSIVWDKINQLKNDKILNLLQWYEVPNYRGFDQDISIQKIFHKGSDGFSVYSGFKAILSENKERIGYFAVSIPEDALFTEAKLSMRRLLMIGFVVSIFTVLYIPMVLN